MGKIFLEIPMWYNFSDNSVKFSSESYTDGHYSLRRKCSPINLHFLKKQGFERTKKDILRPSVRNNQLELYQINYLGKKIPWERATETDDGPAVHSKSNAYSDIKITA